MPTAVNLLNSQGVKLPDIQPGTDPRFTHPLHQNPPQAITAPPSNALAIPNSLAGGLVTQLPEVSNAQGANTSYVFSVSNRSTNFPKFLQAGGQDGEFMLCVEGNYIPLKPLQFFLTHAYDFRTIMDTAGNIVFATKDMKDRTEMQVGGQKQRSGDHYLCMILAIKDGQIIPAKAEFRTTKSSAAVQAIRALGQAAGPDWAGLSEAHKASAGFPYPFGRVVITSAPGAKVTSRSTGHGYTPANTSIAPATLDQMKVLTEFLKDENAMALYNQVYQEFEDRNTYLMNQIKK